MRHLTIFIASLLVSVAASAATFTVTSSADSGPGTLRQAILDANANPGLDQIRFTSGVTVVFPSLPAITDVVDIDGGISTLVQGAAIFTGFTGFDFAPGSDGSSLRHVRVRTFFIGMQIDAGVTGVVIENDTLEALVSIGGDGNTLQDVMSIPELVVLGDANEVHRNGITAAHLLFASANHIGTGNTIGSLDLEASPNTTVDGNTIGSILVQGAGSSSIARNHLGGPVNIMNGVTGVVISQNIGGTIDLNIDGPTPNDPAPDPDSGANNLQNFPVLTSAMVMNNDLVVGGTLDSVPLTAFTIELFAGGVYFASTAVTADAAGHATFIATFPATPAGAITATATNQATNDTSEMSAAAPATLATAIPTLSEWALIALAGALVAIVLMRLSLTAL